MTAPLFFLMWVFCLATCATRGRAQTVFLGLNLACCVALLVCVYGFGMPRVGQ